MWKNLGPLVALYPTPTVVVGMIDEYEKVNWINIAHVGIIGTDSIMLSIKKLILATKLSRINLQFLLILLQKISLKLLILLELLADERSINRMFLITLWELEMFL